VRKVVIVGGGVIGLSTAYALQRQGVPEVTVIDAESAPHGASVVNAGWITPTLSDPVGAPGLIWPSLKGMLKADSPLYIKPDPRDVDLMKWLIGFMRACTQKSFDHAVASLTALNSTTMAEFDALIANGVRVKTEKAGLLMAFLEPRNAETHLAFMEKYGKFGLQPAKVLWGKEARDLEPGLADSVNGAIHIESERHLRPDTLTNGLIEWLSERNVDLRWKIGFTGFAMDGGKVVGVNTTGGTIAADAVVIAAGAKSGQLAKQLGVTLPIQGGKGYSLDYETPPTELSHPLSLYEAHMAVTPMGTRIRLAGTMEFSGINTIVRKERVAALARGASRYIRNWPAAVGTGTVGSGLRPMTPDGMPIIDQLPGHPNVTINTGHQMLGLTLAPVSGSTLAEYIVSGKRPEVLEPFKATRF